MEEVGDLFALLTALSELTGGAVTAGACRIFLCDRIGWVSGAHLDLMDGRADLPRVGAVAKGPSRSLPYVVTDAAGREVEPVSGYLRDLQ
jgi:hypothetical protein